MKDVHLAGSLATSVLVVLSLGRDAQATNFYVGPPGVANGNGMQATPFATIRAGVMAAQPGDTVYIHAGTYGSFTSVRSGTAAQWITFSAFPGELPILDGGAAGGGGTGFSAVGTQYIRVVGLASRRWNSSGFDNGFTNSASNVAFVDCIADNNGINGIAFYNATGVLIENSIVSHNGNQPPSWSSGVNLFGVTGTFADNQVIGNVSFENVDVCGASTCPNPNTASTDGSGFILDQNSTGALFENNIGFHNGGSCIRLTNSPGSHLINNTCYDDAADPVDASPSNPAEIFFSQATTTMNVVVANNLAIGNGKNTGMNAPATIPAGSTFVANVTSGTAASLWVNPAAADFMLAAGASTAIDKGNAADAPSTDIGFDPKCLTQTSEVSLVGLAISGWTYYPDYTYIASVGGVAGCFHPAVRPQGAGPDVGAYELGGAPDDAGTGSSSGSASGGSSGSSSGVLDGGGDAADSSGSGSGGGSGSTSGGGSGSGSGGVSSTSSGGDSGADSSAGSSGGSDSGSRDASTGSSSGGSGGSSGSSSGSSSGATSSGSSGGATGGSSGATSSSGSTGAPDAGSSAVSSDGGDAPPDDTGSTSGCGCHAMARSDSPAGLAVGLGWVFLGARRRRRTGRSG